jgi:formate/nitrite transporter FocA (FNT family)
LHRSFIASYLGNIIGALLVALPAVYFYLSDYNADGLVEAEAGEMGLSGSSSPRKQQEKRED